MPSGCSKDDPLEDDLCQKLHHRPSRLRLAPRRLLNHCRRIRHPFRRWEGEDFIFPVEIKTAAPVRPAPPKPLRCDLRLGLPCIEDPCEVSSLSRRDG
jgi:hypothetical protein